ncbi:MAG: ThuA domain-containing protein [Planctomycetes bacterium]|nr:ThuA domain-containing protein [Planctomycetota bacterium]
MKRSDRLTFPLCAAVTLAAWSPAPAAEPLRVFIRAGAKTHGPGQHDHPRFLAEWRHLLSERGASVDGGLVFPSSAQLDAAQVLVTYSPDGMEVAGEERARFEAFLRRGGGLVVIHDGVVSGDQHEWAKRVQGGAWRWDLPPEKRTKWFEGEVGLYFVDAEHPIVRGISNFDWKDEIYYDLDMDPEVRVLAVSFQSIHILAPQMWTLERTWDGGAAPYRAFVSLAGHEHEVFSAPHHRALLLRGIAWAGKRADVDSLCRPDEVAERALKYPAGGPTPPEEAHEKLLLHPEFEIRLAASEPLVEKVISIEWDPQGRLWVAETPEYPGGRDIHSSDAPTKPYRARDRERFGGASERRPAADRISWLEDSDGDGRMDSKRVFADVDHGIPGGLELVTSLVFHEDGVIVQAAPHILWLRDADSDGVCDRVERLYTGFGTGDSHAVTSNMRWGLDGWIYSAIGYSAGHPRSGDGSRDFGRLTAGVIRFRPDGSQLEQVVSGSCNTWGFDFAPDGEMFYTTATCGEHFLHVVLPEKVLARGSVGGIRGSWVVPDHQAVAPAVHHKRQAYVQVDGVGSFTATAGSCFYDGGAWPERFHGTHFSSDPTVNLLHQELLRPAGSTYASSKEPGREDVEFLAGTDLWFRPIHARVGPDGALYVLDFYNQAVLHNDTRGPPHGARNAATRPDRDHHFARIWRVQHKEAKPIPRPALAGGGPRAWVAALSSPNGWTRAAAARLLRERGAGDALGELAALARDARAKGESRIAALHTLERLGKLDDALLRAAVKDADPVVRKNALRIASEREGSSVSLEPETVRALLDVLDDADPRARLWALIALGSCDATPETARALVEAWPRLADAYERSAALGAALGAPGLVLEAAATAPDDAPALADLAGHLARAVGSRQEPAAARSLVLALAGAPGGTEALKRSALEALAAALRPDVAPSWDGELRSAFAALLEPGRPTLAGAALPLLARWDKAGALSVEVAPWIAHLEAALADETLPDERRAQAASSLLGARAFDAGVVPRVATLLGSSASAALQQGAIEALVATGDPAAGTALLEAYSRVPPKLRDAVFGALVRRSDWARALVEAFADSTIEPGQVGPANLHRLRTHPDKQVAARAVEAIESLLGPRREEKDALVAKLRPVVEAPGGDLESGRKLFAANCAPCHRFKGEGRDLAPDLTGMGAHGPAELLGHVLDPNRQVEPNFLAASVATRDGLVYDGVVARENAAEIVLRNADGDYAIRSENVLERHATGLSLMPEGFESLGAEGLRDLLAYLCADETRFRILDLSAAFTVNTGKGIYSAVENGADAPAFHQHGLVHVEGVPFALVSPQKAAANALVLRGGSGLAKTLPRGVEVPVGVAAARLCFLGGIAGWGWPCGGDQAKGKPLLKVVLRFAGGGTEEMVFRNGVEFADWIGPFDVPGSKGVPELTKRGQVRWFLREVEGRSIIERLSLESFDGEAAPTLLAITAELAAPPPRVLIAGGGSAHDFERWFHQADLATLRSGGAAEAGYTGRPEDLPAALPALDALCQTSNQAFASPAVRQAVLGFAAAGKGLVLIHAGLWYNWPDWPEYNRVLCGGGSRGHDRFGRFEVRLTEDGKRHPVTRGLPESFSIEDELYWFEPDPEGTPIAVLATARSTQKDATYPVVFAVQHPRARIAAITLGHDGKAHEHEAYVRLLEDAVRWAARR